jgi:GNAT superfamily N-acetyltransferase
VARPGAGHRGRCAAADRLSRLVRRRRAERDRDARLGVAIDRRLGTEFLLAASATATAAAGVCQLRFRHSVWTSREDCWLEDLFVEERARGNGLGRALVLAAFTRAGERGAARIELDTNEVNRGAIGLYESLGFSAQSKAHGPLQGRDLFMGRRL